MTGLVRRWNFVVPDFTRKAAEIFVAVMALVIMLASTFARSIARNYLLTQATLIVAAFITIFDGGGGPYLQQSVHQRSAG